jgi:putative transposase
MPEIGQTISHFRIIEKLGQGGMGEVFLAHDASLKQSGTKSLRLPSRSPDLSPHIERFMLSVKEECLHRMILIGEKSLRNAVRDFLVHYHKERNNQGLSNRLIKSDEEVGRTTGEIACRERLGSVLRYYYCPRGLTTAAK